MDGAWKGRYVVYKIPWHLALDKEDMLEAPKVLSVSSIGTWKVFENEGL